MCALRCQNVVRQTSSIKHFEIKHEKFFKDDAEKIGSLKKAVSRHKKQSRIFKKVIRSTNQTIEGSYKVAEAIAKNGNHLLMAVCKKVLS